MSAYRRTDIEFGGPGLISTYEEAHKHRQPPGSKNEHFFCGDCGDYLGLDATRWLGFAAVASGKIEVSFFAFSYRYK